MSYVSNQYNYATPPSSISGLVGEQRDVADKKYFTLFDNVLDGSYYPIVGDVGLWGSSLSDAEGVLATPFVVTVNGYANVRSIAISCSSNCFFVDFTVEFLNGTYSFYTHTVTGNNSPVYVQDLPYLLTIDRYVLTVTKISAPNSVAMLYNAYNPSIIHATDTLSIKTSTSTNIEDIVSVVHEDRILLHVATDRTDITGLLNSAQNVPVAISESSDLTNVHTKMKEPTRRIYGRVRITYTDPMRSSETTIKSSGTAYNSMPLQLMDGNMVSDNRLFTLYENDLSGKYIVGDKYSQVGWTSTLVSDENGYFTGEAPYLRVDFAERPMLGLPITFDVSRGCIVEDFTVEYIRADGITAKHSIVGNKEATVVIDAYASNVVAVILTITKISKPFMPVTVLEIPIISTIEYVGYSDKSNLISIDLLEELAYLDDVEALGGISANEITVALDNSNRDFYFNNPRSIIASALRRNRKIVPELGVEVIDGEIEWHTLGTFWSHTWNVPVEGLVATVTGFDTIGLLGKTSFTDHTMRIGESIGQLIEYVLDDARSQLDFIEYRIDPALYTVRIPYAWFEPSNHAAALRKISECYPMHIYCDRQGVICAAPQRLATNNPVDTWADNTNVISKNYSSMFTALPNIIEVELKHPSILTEYELTFDDIEFSTDEVSSRQLLFGAPYISDFELQIDCDETVWYTYNLYSWGVDITFIGAGTVRSIRCIGTALDIGRTSVMTGRDDASVRINGAIARQVSSDFIQTRDVASTIINRILSLTEFDAFDADVDYRGDIALSINDTIRLLNGIAPRNIYTIRRHELSWNGALTGSAHLNT